MGDMSGRCSSSQRCSVRVRQMRPRPCLAMKLMASGVIFSAAMVRSPSFSRSSSSTRTIMWPWRISSTACSTVANFGGMGFILLPPWDDAQDELVAQGGDPREAPQSPPPPGCFCERVRNCLKRKELRFALLQKSLEECENKGDRGDRGTKLEIGNAKTGTLTTPSQTGKRIWTPRQFV